MLLSRGCQSATRAARQAREFYNSNVKVLMDSPKGFNSLHNAGSSAVPQLPVHHLKTSEDWVAVVELHQESNKDQRQKHRNRSQIEVEWIDLVPQNHVEHHRDGNLKCHRQRADQR